MYLSPDHPARAVNFSPKPKDFTIIEQFLDNDQIQPAKFDSEYRFMFVPLYQPLTGYLRYNYPNFLYVAAFSPAKEATQFVQVTNNLMANHDPAVIFPLEMASVKYLSVVPSSFSLDELESWRLGGVGRTSGPHIFGDISKYRSFLSDLSMDRLKDQDSAYILNNVIPRVTVPTILVEAEGDMKEVFRSLKPLKRIIRISDYVMTFQPSESSGKQTFTLRYFEDQKKMDATVSGLHANEIDYKFSSEAKPININSIIIWSDSKELRLAGNYIFMKGNIAHDKSHLSIWVEFPHTSLSGLPLIEMEILTENKTIDDIVFEILDENKEVLESEIDKQLIDEKENHYKISIIPTETMPDMLRIILNGINGTEQKIALENIVHFKLLDTLATRTSSDFPEIQDLPKLPQIVTGFDLLILPEITESGGLIFTTLSENQPINKNSLIVWSEEKKVLPLSKFLSIEGVVPIGQPEKELSIWVKVPSTNILGLPNIQFNLFAENKTIDDVRFVPIDEDGAPLPVEIEKSVLDVKRNFFQVSITPLDTMPTWIRVLIEGDNNSTQKIMLENKILFTLEEDLPSSDSKRTQSNQIKFPYLVTNHDRLILPERVVNNQFFFSIGDVINTARSSFVTLQSKDLDEGWNKMRENVRWISPVEINVDLQLRVDGEKKQIVVPLFLGNAFNDAWDVDVKTSSGFVSKTEHLLGNGFANLWLFTINGEAKLDKVIDLSFKVYWDPLSLYIHQIRNIVGLLIFISPIPLYFVYVRSEKREK